MIGEEICTESKTNGFGTQTSQEDVAKDESYMARIYEKKVRLEAGKDFVKLLYKPEDIKNFVDENKEDIYKFRDCANYSWVELIIPCEQLPYIDLKNEDSLVCENGETLVQNLSQVPDGATNLPRVLLQTSETPQGNKHDEYFFKLLMEYAKVVDWEQFDLQTGEPKSENVSKGHKWLNFTNGGKTLQDVADYLYIAQLFQGAKKENDHLEILGYQDYRERPQKFAYASYETANKEPLHCSQKDGEEFLKINTYSTENQESLSQKYDSQFLNIDMQNHQLASQENLEKLYAFIKQDTPEEVMKKAEGKQIPQNVKQYIIKGRQVRAAVLQSLNKLSNKLYGKEIEIANLPENPNEGIEPGD